MDQNLPRDYSDGEISLKEVVLTIKEYALEIRRKWKVLAVFCLLALIYCFYLFFTTPTHFVAECSFMLNEKDNNAGLAGILGEFGFGGNTEFRLEKIVELAKTRTMTESVMFEKVEIGQESDLLANHFINVLENEGTWMPKKWFSKKDELIGFRFSSADLEGFSRTENRAIQTINRRVKERLVTNINDVTGILNFSFESPDEEISYEFLRRLYDNLGEYYTNKSIEKQEATYKAFALKCDSLESELNSKEYQLANFKDTYRSQWLNVENTKEDKLYREIRMLGIMYGEALKNKEVAAFSLANVRPFIQAIDLPIYPLKRIQLLWWWQLITGLAIGIALGSLFVVVTKMYREMMA